MRQIMKSRLRNSWGSFDISGVMSNYTITLPANSTISISQNGTTINTGNSMGVAASNVINNVQGQGQWLTGDITENYNAQSQALNGYYPGGLTTTTGGYGTASVYGGLTGGYVSSGYNGQTSTVGGTGSAIWDTSIYAPSSGYINGVFGNQYQIVTEDMVAEAITTKNYETLTQMGNAALGSSIKLFRKIEKAVRESKDWTVIMNFIVRTTNYDMKHYTKLMLNAFAESSDPDKEIKLASYIAVSMFRIDMKKYVKFGVSQRSHKLLESVVTTLVYCTGSHNNYGGHLSNYIYTNTVMSTFPAITEKVFRKNYGVKYSEFEDVICQSENENILYSLFSLNTELSKQKLFQRVRKLGKSEMALKMIEESKEKWGEELRNMK